MEIFQNKKEKLKKNFELNGKKFVSNLKINLCESYHEKSQKGPKGPVVPQKAPLPQIFEIAIYRLLEQNKYSTLWDPRKA